MTDIPNHPDSSWHIALELYILGEFERALAYQAERGNIPQDAWSTRYAAARDLEAFMPYIESLNLTKVWDELGPPPPCRQVADGYDCSSGAHR